MKKLKITLQSNTFFYILFITVLLFVLIRNKIGYKTKINVGENISGQVIEIIEKESTNKLTIKGKEKVIVYYEDISNINLGDIIYIEGEYQELQNNTIPNNFNYKKYLYNNHIFHVIYADKIKIIKKNNNIIYKIKTNIINRADTFKNKGYIKAFLIGDKTNLDTYSIYQENGISHLFALSGMHISLMSLVLYKLFNKSKFKDLIVIILLLFYVTLTNLSASIIRTIIFFIILKINKKLDLNMSTKNSLILTICLIMINNTLIIYDIGFLYSSIVTFGLIVSTKYYQKKYFINLLITSLIALIFSLPITIYHNYEINIMSLINNLINVPLVTYIIYPLSLLTFIFKFLEPLYNIAIIILEFVNKTTSLLNILIIIPKVNNIFYLIYYMLLYFFIKSNNLKYLLLSIILILSFKLLPLLNPNYNIYYLDVGQGDSSLIIYRNDVTMIDTGGIRNKTISDNTIKFLKSLGHTKIKTLIITHGDYDHMGDAINIVNNLKVEKVIFNCGEFNELEKDLIKVLNNKKIPYYSCVKELNINQNKLYFLNNKNYDNENDNSTIIYIELEKYKLLFMGDAGVEVEEDLLKKYNLNIDILKVGHHGSKTSSSEEFINAISPGYSIISVGENNRYGHPNKNVLEKLKESKIYRTDQDGSIMFKIKNNKLKIET